MITPKTAMRFAVADPPYPGMSRLYKGHPDYAGEVDHRELIDRLGDYDGWALCTASTTLRHVLSLCPAELDVRIMAWVKPFASFKPGVNPAYTWEPVIFHGGRKRSRERPTVKDHHVESITMRRGLVGAKPVGFCLWLFDCLGAEPGDDLHDLFPGTGAVGEAWRIFRERESGVMESGLWELDGKEAL